MKGINNTTHYCAEYPFFTDTHSAVTCITTAHHNS